MFFIHAEASPATPETRASYRGAFVNCWVAAPSSAAARRAVMDLLAESGWQLGDIAESRITDRDEWDGDSVENFDRAVSDGVVVQLHTYHLEPIPWTIRSRARRGRDVV